MRLLSFAALAALLLAALPAEAQPRRGVTPQATLQATAEPASAEIRAGGADRNGVPGNGCSGFIDNGQPAATVSVSGGSGPLAIYAVSGVDTTLLVADPDGRWHCSDDANGSNPAVTFANARSGTYTVWVGTFSPQAAGASAQLHAVRGRPRW